MLNAREGIVRWFTTLGSSTGPDVTVTQDHAVINFWVQVVEPYFAPLGQEIRRHVLNLHALWTRLALGHGAAERTFAIALGYAVVALLLSLYLNVLTVGNVRAAGRDVRNAVRQQLLIVKVMSKQMILLNVF